VFEYATALFALLAKGDGALPAERAGPRPRVKRTSNASNKNWESQRISVFGPS